MIDPSVLARVGLFAELSADELAVLWVRLRRRMFAKDQIIFAEGDPGTSLYLVETGRVKISLASPEGKELVLNILGPGDFFGELALLDGEPRSADAVAQEPSQLLLLGREDFVSFVESSPMVAMGLLTAVGRWLRRSTQVARDGALLDVPSRLARVLLDLAEPRGEPVDEKSMVVAPRLTQSELAAMIGATRESVNKSLGYFERQGIIRRDGRMIRILRPEALRGRIV